ncbi:sigma-70 family RNA polymerase sigma factor [Petralouisia muris]|uniref:Sigma-70 family RNA polymerase sigma factor n=1 Tax=Petralouisia muris TaxID=3032872 RepID=A0AC61S216_9FIRM|nr:sigma-70 family RNA polymerase sigma factor [Petralouisia muris]TGY97951.1 sigma-70 family RNA polymerase sigma factor [Petralouisia muris]
MEDTAIIDLFWERKEAAIEELSGKYSGYCYKIAWNLLMNHEDSEECLNDTWLSAWNYMPPKRPSRLAVFVGRITRGLAIDCFRKKHAAKRPDAHRADVCFEMDELSLSYTIEEQMAEKKLLEEIEKFLWKLPKADRDIFIRRYWYLDPICEIAKRHKASAGCIKTNLCRNRKKLFRILEQEVMGQ